MRLHMVEWLVALTLAVACGVSADPQVLSARHAPKQAVVPQEPQSQPQAPSAENPVVTLPEGYVIPVRVTEEIDSKHGHSGEMYSGSVDPSVLVNDMVVIPRGTEAHLRLVQNKKGGHLHGKAEVTLELVSLGS